MYRVIASARSTDSESASWSSTACTMSAVFATGPPPTENANAPRIGCESAERTCQATTYVPFARSSGRSTEIESDVGVSRLPVSTRSTSSSNTRTESGNGRDLLVEAEDDRLRRGRREPRRSTAACRRVSRARAPPTVPPAPARPPAAAIPPARPRSRSGDARLLPCSSKQAARPGWDGRLPQVRRREAEGGPRGPNLRPVATPAGDQTSSLSHRDCGRWTTTRGEASSSATARVAPSRSRASAYATSANGTWSARPSRNVFSTRSDVGNTPSCARRSKCSCATKIAGARTENTSAEGRDARSSPPSAPTSSRTSARTTNAAQTPRASGAYARYPCPLDASACASSPSPVARRYPVACATCDPTIARGSVISQTTFRRDIDSEGWYAPVVNRQ